MYLVGGFVSISRTPGQSASANNDNYKPFVDEFPSGVHLSLCGGMRGG